jgi:hypothetical protein
VIDEILKIGSNFNIYLKLYLEAFMSIFKQVIFFVFGTVGFLMEANANCSRCTKIEEERKKEQAEHPVQADYYDDAIHLHDGGLETGKKNDRV